MKNYALSVENLEKYFPAVATGWRAFFHSSLKLTEPALRGISFAVNPGEIFALVGANGAGKSTLLRILTTLLVPTGGSAQICGFNVVHDPARVRLKIGYHTGSDGSFYARLSARDNLELFAGLNNIPAKQAANRIAELARLFGLEDVLDRQVRALSTGNGHRLGLARAMLHQPSVLLLDEPTRSLDPVAAAEFRRFLVNRIVREHGTTVVFSSHTMAEVEQIATRVAVLDAGRLLICDTPENVRAATGTSTLEQSIEILTESVKVQN